MELVAGVASWVWGSWLFLGSWLKLGHFSEEQLQQRSPGNYGVDWRSPGCRSGQGTWELEWGGEGSWDLGRCTSLAGGAVEVPSSPRGAWSCEQWGTLWLHVLVISSCYNKNTPDWVT
jgi:hypothetical protein